MNETRSRGRSRVLVALAATVGLIGALLMTSPASAAPTTHWVDGAAAASAPGTGCGADAGYSTVQAALDAAASGDTIEVCPGTYSGQLTIQGKGDLTIRGAKAGITAGPSGTLPVDRGAGESIIESDAASVVRWSGGLGVNITFDGLTIRQTGPASGAGHAFQLGQSGHTIVNNIIEYTGAAAVSAQQSAFIHGAFSGITIEGNRIDGFRYGFNFQSGNLADAPSTIEGNYVEYGFTGVILGNNTANGHLISGNTFVARSGAGGQAVNTPARLMEISYNSMTGAGSSSGIFLPGTNPGTGANPLPATSGTQIFGNTITGYNWGIYQGTPSAQLPAGSPPNEVNLNNIAGNVSWGLFNQASPGVLDVEATCNWWGDASGPRTEVSGPGDRVSLGNVDYTPWLVAPAPGGDCVGGLANPTAEFSADPTSGDAPLPVDFDASASTVESPRTLEDYDWDFGDGNTGTGVTTSHTYSTPGEYVVTLTVTDNFGLQGTSATTITVTAPNAAPTASATATPDSGTAPLVVTLDGSGSTDIDGEIVSYEWDLGDGNAAVGAVVSHTYTTPGTYVATLTVTDDDGLTGEAQVVINVSAPNNPENKNDCKKGGWESYGFSNQGLCIRYVNTGKDARIGE